MGRDEHQGALLHRGHVHSLYRWTRLDGTPLVTKVLDAERRTDAAAVRLRREFAILRELAALPGVVDALELREEEGDLCLDLRDTGGTNLASYLDEASLSLTERLALAVQVAEILGRVHVAGVVHRDVKPRNILVSADRAISLIDFGIASHGAHDVRADAGGEDEDSPASLHGTLSYIAPEQTGRLRTPVDHRADLYSLGVTLYQLFTGQLPFTADDPAQLIHAHLAKLPTPPDALAPELPSALSQALLKLLAKAPDDRYRSAFGLAHDLAAIQSAVLRGESSSVVLGAYDPPLLFRIPDHLYGREEALETLSGAYTRASSGSPELVVLRGTSGSGKSALFRALRRQHLGEGARFADGVYEPGRLHVPYSALFDALSKPLEELLLAGDDVRARARWGLLKALGGLASALTPRLPALTELLGSVDATPGEERLSVDATRNRLHRALHILVRGLAGPRTPLVLFLDDVQWIDQASLQLLIDLVDETASDGLFCIFAYDDDALESTVGADETTPPATIEATLLRLSDRARVSSIELRPLDVAAISAMIADTLALPEARVQDLAAVIVDKSGGSGFFAAELLTELHAAGAIRFDAGRGAWTYDLATASELSVTANVVDLLLGRARTLDPRALALLQRGACLGMSFTVAEIGPERASSDVGALGDGDGDDGRALDVLGGACMTGLVSAVPGGFVFPHERIREAIAATLDPSERAAIHLALGRRAWADAEAAIASDDLVFKTAEQIIAAGSLISESEERRRGARLCLAAARRARAGAAFRSTISFCRAGAGLLGEAEWSDDYELLFPLLALENECALALGDLKVAEETTEVLLRNARCDEDRAEILLTRGGILLAENKLDEVVDIAAEAARLLGGHLPRRPSTPSLVLGMIRAKRAIGRRTPIELLDLPPLLARRDQLLMEAYALASGSGFQSDPRLLIQIAAKMITLTLRRGLHASVAPAFILYGIAAGSPSGDTALMDAYGSAALDLLRRFPDRSVEPMVRFLYGGLVQCMSHPYRACIATLREGTRIGVESGALAAAGLAAMAATSQSVFAGLDLDRVRVEAEAALALAKAAKIGSSEWIIRVDLGFARALLGSAEGPRFSNPDLDEATLDARDDPSIAPSTFYAYLHRRLLYHLILCQHDEAREVLRRADPGVKEIFRFFNSYIDYRLLRALTLAMSPETDGMRWTIRQLERTLREVRRAAANNPANFGVLFELVTAELRRLRGKADTPEAFERALASASREHNTLHEALVAERAGRYYLSRGLHDSAKAYLRRARRAYGRWRAKEKVVRLDSEFPGLDRRAPTAMPATMADVSITLTAEPSSSSATSSSGGSSASASSHVVDLASIIKAAQVFAAEIDLDVLSERMLRLVVENAGAERGVLLLVEEGAVVAVTEYSARGDRIIDHGRAPVETVASIPHALVLRAHRRGCAEVFEDAASDPLNAADSYVQRLKLRSALALPLIARGRGIGVVYLENNLATGVFTEERLDILQVLAVQAAVALDHADFFRRIDAARDAAESASLAKSRFLANMSHELRTPLNAILGYAELIAEDAQDAGFGQISDDVGRIRQAGAHLLALVSEILDLTKVESGEHDLERTPIVLEELLDGTCELLRGELQSGGNTLIRDDGDDLGVFVGDPIRLRQILVNLLSNASKFTDHGTITLRSRRREDGVDFAVIDTGIGLGEDQLTSIFEPFVQVDETSTRRYGGVGLGLTICRGLAEQMGGTLTVRSELGVGSTFTLRLPLTHA